MSEITEHTKGKNPLIRLLDLSISISVFTMTGILILQVFFRYALDSSLSWSEELSRYMMIWTAMLGAVAVLDEGDFVSFRWIINLMGPLMQRVLRVLMIICSLFFLIILTYFGTKLALYNMNQMSPALNVPIGWVYVALPVGSFLIALRMVAQIFQKQPPSEHQVSI